jgi:hypothetical protein
MPRLGRPFIAIAALCLWMFAGLAMAALTVAPTSITLPTGKSAAVSITGGSGSIVVTVTGTAATAKLSSVRRGTGTLTVTAVTPGTASIAIRDSRGTKTLAIAVLAPMTVAPNPLAVAVGGHGSVTASNAIGALTVTSANAGVATVSASGTIVTVNGIVAGATTIAIKDSYTTVVLPVTVSASAAGKFVLFAWNDLGMHCMDTDYSVFTLLPPFNNLNAQLIANGKLVNDDVSSAGYTIEYQAMSDPGGSVNSSHKDNASNDKTNFWTYFNAMFGLGNLTPGIGMTGNPTPTAKAAPLAWNGTLKDDYRWFEATGIPVTPKDDAGATNPFPMVKVTAKSKSTGQVLATTSAVLPVSTEMNCAACHVSTTGAPDAMPAGGWIVDSTLTAEQQWRMNALRKHDDRVKPTYSYPYVDGKGATITKTYAQLLAEKGFIGTTLEGSVKAGNPIFCDTCHNSNALAYWGLAGAPGVSQITAAMHTKHATATLPGAAQPLDAVGTRDACYACHPGKETKCLRGAMGNPLDPATGKHLMECQSCHGSMKVVGSALIADPNAVGGYRPRNPWFDMPTCQTCHQNGQRSTSALTVDASSNRFAYKGATDTRFATNADTPLPGLAMYRFSVGHGKLQCEACHNSTHAEFTTKTASNSRNDDVRAVSAQGYAAALRECTVCHASVPSTRNGGPHGMHTIGQSWVSGHEEVVNSTTRADCLYCHGSTSAGSDLAVIKVAKTFRVDDGHTRSFAAEERVTCWSCHNGPNP